MQSILGEPTGIPDNRTTLQEQTTDYEKMIDKTGVDLEDLSLPDQFREIGRRLSMLGL